MRGEEVSRLEVPNDLKRKTQEDTNMVQDAS